ncbi:hypothetical protein O6H91_05G071600 [Diphasiastrum complanatum]|nr:hypothetical protein O6H91_05G071600 [Diphasiastrum complanatum]
MSDILAQVATNTESNKNAGNAILYECVLTIMAIEAIGGLRVLAINILGRFLGNRDNNIRYVALNTLIKVVAVDTQAVQRHRTTIVECVKDSDISIRRRALELVCALVNESNVKTLTKELLEYLKVSDPEFKPDLTTKICYLVQKFFPNKRWYIDQMIKVMVEAGRFVKDDISRALLLLISNAAELQGYTVRSLYNAFQKWDGQESLAQVTVWCIGEYGEMLVHHMNELDGEEPVTVTEADTVDVLELVLKDFRASSTTRAFALTALLKVSSRFPSCTERIKALVLQYKGSLVLELQQRSIEFTSILSKHENIKASLVEKMPVLDEATYIAKKVDAADVAFSTDSKSVPATVLPAVPVANGPTKSKSGTNALMDLLNLNVDEASTPSAPQTRKSAGDVLLDLLGGNSSFTSPLVASPVQGPSGGADALLDLLSIGNATSQTTSSPLSTLEPFPQRNPEAASQKPSNPVPDLLSQNTVSSQKDSYSSFTADFKKSSIPGAGFDLLGDLGIGSASSISTTGPVYPPIVAFQSSGLTVSFEFSKQSTNLPATVIHATYTNTSSNTYTDVIFQAAVPKFMQLQLEPASGNVLPANSSGTVTQVIRVNNSQHGQKSLVMRIRVSYKINGQEVLEQGQVNNFPPGL